MKNSFKRYFFVSMVFSFFFILLLMGFAVVEKNAEAIISGENLSFVSYKIEGFGIKFFKIHFMGQDFTLNFE